MPYVHVLQLIDTEIARLQRVRELLLPSLPTKLIKALPFKHLQSPQPIGTAVPAQQATTLAAEPVVQVPVTITYMPPRRERVSKGKGGRRNKAPLTAINTAFQGPVPNGPVYVSADKLRITQQKQESEARKTPGDVFTAEQLSKLWLRSTAN